MGYRIGIDVGGTFTDFVLVRTNGELILSKTPTTLEDQSLGVMNAIQELASREGLDTAAFLAATDLIVHGTTTADNTMIEMSGALTGLLTTEGHRDEIDIRRGFKEDIWDPSAPPPVPIAPRRRRLGVPERLNFRGEVVRPLDEAATRVAIRRLKQQGVESIAVVLLFSFINAAHEKRVRELIEEEYPGVRVSLSHEVMPTAPEFERTSTTLVDAYVGPRVETYLKNLQAALRNAGYAHDLLIMQSNSGLATAEGMSRRAVSALGSGPTAGVKGACETAQRAGIENFIAVDMGGTSYEACLVHGGTPTIRSYWNWQHRYLVGLPMLEMHSIGAGGGSIAYVEAGALKVGPRSAKANPGPICYGRGGTEPTVSDANLVLGYLNPGALCGGDFKLSSEGVREAIEEKIAKPLNLELVKAAYGIFRIVNANMANAIRRVSSQAGFDPREFQMVVYGGNGPMHAGMQAAELGIKSYIVPKTSPAFSALGLLVADYLVDIQRSYISPAAQADVNYINRILDETEAQSIAELEVAGLGREDIEFVRSLNICYPGQTFDMAVPMVLTDTRMREADLKATIVRFHDQHEELHTYAQRDEAPVLRAVRIQAIGQTEKPTPLEYDAGGSAVESALRERRPAYFGDGYVDTPVYDGDLFRAGHRVDGPAIIEERFTTIVLYPGQSAELDHLGNYVVEVAK